MNAEPGKAPVIIAGMHRSGTTLLCHMLSTLGVFLGWRREANEESRTFLEINKWLLLQSGGAWDLPPDPTYFEEAEARALCTRFMTYAMNSIWMSFYLGRLHLSRSQEAPRFPGVWGWKDPRNTLTLPLWADLYPDATLIHVTRHGVDVAHSLSTRRSQRIRRMSEQFHVRKHVFWLRLRKRRFETGHGSLEAALDLWQRYQELAEQGSRRFCKAITIRFEDLVSDPRSTLESVASILEMAPDESSLAAACALPEPDRVYAWQENERLVDFALEHADQLGRWGYHD